MSAQPVQTPAGSIPQRQLDDLLDTSRVDAALEWLRKLVEAGDRLSHGSPDRNAIEDIISDVRKIVT